MNKLIYFISALLFTFFLLSVTPLFAQGGVYYTLEDYKAGRLTKVGKYKNTKHFAHRFKVIFESESGERQEFGMEELWGFQNDKGEDYRINKEKLTPHKIHLKGAMYYYGNYASYIREEKKGNIFVYCDLDTKRNFPFAVSKGPDGEMMEVSNENLNKITEGKLLEGVEVKKVRDSPTLEDLIIRYNKQHP